MPEDRGSLGPLGADRASARARRGSDTVPVYSPFPAEPGLDRLRWWERLRSAVGLLGMVVLGGVLAALAVAALILVAAITIATAFS